MVLSLIITISYSQTKGFSQFVDEIFGLSYVVRDLLHQICPKSNVHVQAQHYIAKAPLPGVLASGASVVYPLCYTALCICTLMSIRPKHQIVKKNETLHA